MAGQLALIPAGAAPEKQPDGDLVAVPYIDELNKDENNLVERLLQEEVNSPALAFLLAACLPCTVRPDLTAAGSEGLKTAHGLPQRAAQLAAPQIPGMPMRVKLLACSLSNTWQ